MRGMRRTFLVCSLAAAAFLALAVLASAGGTTAPARQGPPGALDAPQVTPTPTVDIGAATPIACGQAAVGNTSGATNHVSVYGCAPWLPLSGPERVYALNLSAGAAVDALLSGLNSDLDLLLLTGSSPVSCIAHGDNAISARGLAAGVYYLVVDGFDGAAGPFQLNVWCPLAVTATPTPTVTPTATPRPAQRVYYLPLLLHSLEARR